MKAKFISQPLSLIVLFVILASPAWARWESVNKTIERSFNMNSSAILDFSNKYGDIKMSAYDGNEVVIKVYVSLDGKESKAADMLERIKINFSHTPDRLEAKTIVPKGNYQNLQIDWVVKFPVTNNLDITNMYGDLIIDESKATTRLDVSYGDIKIGHLQSKKNDVELHYGEGTLEQANYLDLKLRYSEMDRIGKVKLLNLDAMYSETAINSVGRLNIKSAYDEHDINAVAELNISSMYTDIHVGTITMKLDCDMTYGDIRVNKIKKSFDAVAYENAYGDAKLTFESGSVIDLDADAAYGDIHLPRGEWNKKDRITATSVTGTNGSGGKPVNINVSFGDVKIAVGP